MGFYAKCVLPRLIDLTMCRPEAARLHRESVPHAAGDVLELGIGSALNRPLCSARVHSVFGVGP